MRIFNKLTENVTESETLMFEKFFNYQVFKLCDYLYLQLLMYVTTFIPSHIVLEINKLIIIIKRNYDYKWFGQRYFITGFLHKMNVYFKNIFKFFIELN